jgi:lipid A 3-O-deacylase
MKLLGASLLFFLLHVPCVAAQTGPAQAGRELELWAGGGPSVTGGAGNIDVSNVGLRYGWVLTGPHGPGILRGRFEYAVDVVPGFSVIEPRGTAYGFDLDPIVWKWAFQERRRVVPYLEASGGALFTNRDVPAGVSRVNFTPGGALGLYLPAGRYDWSVELRYMHISDAGLTSPNPGVDTIQVRVGFGLFMHRNGS